MSPVSPPISHAELEAREQLAAAINDGDLERVGALLGAHPRLPALPLHGAGNALTQAAARGRREIAELLMERGAALDATPKTPGENALYAALQNGQLALAKCLAGRGVTLDAVLAKGWSVAPLWAAAFQGDNDELSRFLLGHSVGLRNPERSLLAGLQEAARAHCNAAIPDLLRSATQFGVDLGDGHAQPLRAAIAHQNLPAARLLLDRGARLAPASFLDARCLWPPTLRRGDRALAAAILEAGFDLEAWESEHGSLLARWPEGSTRAHPVLTLLLDHGLDLNATAAGYGTPLYAALAAGRVTLYRFLIEHGADPGHDHQRALPFFFTAGALALDEDELRFLNAHGHDLNTRDAEGRGVLQHAVDRRAPGETLERLRRLGAEPR